MRSAFVTVVTAGALATAIPVLAGDPPRSGGERAAERAGGGSGNSGGGSQKADKPDRERPDRPDAKTADKPSGAPPNKDVVTEAREGLERQGKKPSGLKNAEKQFEKIDDPWEKRERPDRPDRPSTPSLGGGTNKPQLQRQSAASPSALVGATTVRKPIPSRRDAEIELAKAIQARDAHRRLYVPAETNYHAWNAWYGRMLQAEQAVHEAEQRLSQAR